jgi:DNA polymerase III subunit delta'
MLAPRERWPVIGHDQAIDQLARALESNRVSHAYLFTGPDGIGRRALATAFAQALSCQQPVDERPCGVCSACRRVAQGIYPDVTGLSLESQTAADRRDSKNTVISIDSIRELRASVTLRPLEGRWRVVIIEDVDRLSLAAYDALLKTLEEPPSFVVLLLIATEYDALPETIRSRCRHIPLEPVSRDLVAAALRERGAPDADAELLARLTRGRIGHAFDLLENEPALERRRALVEGGLEMLESPLAALAAARRLADVYRRGQRDRVAEEIDTLLGLWRDLLLLRSGCEDDVVNVDARDRLGQLAVAWSLPEIRDGLHSCHQTLFDLSVNVQPRLALDHMVMQWPEPR